MRHFLISFFILALLSSCDAAVSPEKAPFQKWWYAAPSSVLSCTRFDLGSSVPAQISVVMRLTDERAIPAYRETAFLEYYTIAGNTLSFAFSGTAEGQDFTFSVLSEDRADLRPPNAIPLSLSRVPGRDEFSQAMKDRNPSLHSFMVTGWLEETARRFPPHGFLQFSGIVTADDGTPLFRQDAEKHTIRAESDILQGYLGTAPHPVRSYRELWTPSGDQRGITISFGKESCCHLTLDFQKNQLVVFSSRVSEQDPLLVIPVSQEFSDP